MLATQAPRDFAGESPQGFVGGIDDKPVAPDFMRFGTEGFHQNLLRNSGPATKERE
jgi:hypothetical protein